MSEPHLPSKSPDLDRLEALRPPPRANTVDPGAEFPALRGLKYQSVRDQIRHSILSGKFKPGSRLPSDAELNHLYRVGRHSIIRALAELTQEGLLIRRQRSGTFVAELGNEPLVFGKYVRLAALWHEELSPQSIHSTMQGAILQGSLSRLRLNTVRCEWDQPLPGAPTRASWHSLDHGVTLVGIGRSFRNPLRHPQLDQLRSSPFDGILAISIIEDQWISGLFDLNVPCVLADYGGNLHSDRADIVYFDPWQGIHDAVRWLASRGLKRIHFLGCLIGAQPGQPKAPALPPAQQPGKQYQLDPDSNLRIGAYLEAMRSSGLPVNTSWIHFSPYRRPECCGLAASLAALPAPERPQAFICHGLKPAQWMHLACLELGSEVEAVGVEDPALPPVSSGLRPEEDTAACEGKVSALEVNSRQMGLVAADLLVSRLQFPERAPIRAGIPMRFMPHP